MKKTTLLAIITLFFIVKSTNAQSPWTREKGKAYVQLGLTGLFYNSIEFDGKKSNLNSDYTDITTQIYSEYGITNNLEAQLIIPFKFVGYKAIVGNNSENLSGVGNLTLGLKYKIYDAKWKVSTGIQYAANSITKDAVKRLSTGFNANTILPYVTAGTSSGKWYYFGTIGYGYMDNNYSDYIKFTAEVGYNAIQNGHIMLVLDTRNVVSKESAYYNDTNQWASYLDRQTYNAVGLKLNYEFKKDKLGVNFSTFGAFGIDNAPLAPTFNLGVYTKL
ncbi:hypothetical protein [Flavobacterium cellulosilyticum]|uniref:Transporter n=1 Tax=Flavobacterium cellulosilyticum TaxID=2541731 RepID=A0A4R5C8P4_9FLAO|nr:hypothetical protein [Flavobacterium cellulosilyticum]TDD95545.1 hypothetical protein E0F76_13860 [Flavobacterium cellulosilyticum]